MTEPERLHLHPIEGPVVVVHSREVLTHEGLARSPMHSFGPFATEEEARRWEADDRDDTCKKVIIAIFDPWEQRR